MSAGGDAKTAALRMLLEDVAPLFDRAEQLNTTLAQVDGALRGDIERLGGMMQSLEQHLGEASELMAGLQGVQRSGLKEYPVPPGTRASGHSTRAVIGAAVAASVITAAIIGTGAWLLIEPTLQHEQFGREVSAAWPRLDPETKAKISQAAKQPR
jgi:hypothetical protein